MTYYSDIDGSCWPCCVASLVGCAPSEVPHRDEDYFDLARQNDWLEERGDSRRFVPVWAAGTWRDCLPSGMWIAWLNRGHNLFHAVLCDGNQIAHDPAYRNSSRSRLNVQELAASSDQSIPMGFELVAA